MDKKVIQEKPITDWLPITWKEVEKRGWEELDVILISGDAYVDHPAFGPAVIGRILEHAGYRIALIPQPNWRDDLRDFKKFGKPKLFFGVTAGCMDSMVNHYTAGKRKRATDAYTPGGEAGFRPDYSVNVYTKILKKLYPDVPVLIGGIEASLRRVTHYDYWEDRLFPTVLETSGADMLVYGMGEQALREILKLSEKGVPFSSMRTIPQTAFLVGEGEKMPRNKNWKDVEINAHQDCLKDKLKYAGNFKIVEQESNKVQARRILQKVAKKTLVINPPYPPMEEAMIDLSFDLPYTRLPHPKYKKRGNIPAFEMIKFSINMHRGCFGGCSFCTISAHQGKFIASRSEKSILKEVDKVSKMPDFKGYISDLGGPSANMYRMKGKVQEICDRCSSPSCIHPVVCHNLDTSHKALTQIYKKASAHPEVKKAFVSSGIRYDLLVEGHNKVGDSQDMEEYMDNLIQNHIAGRLKVAPEHTSDQTLKMMRKPSFRFFHDFKKRYDRLNKKHKKEQPLIPYFISGHPGCEEQDMANLACETKDMGFQLEQVQGFTPTPMTVATVIYYAGVHPYTLQPHYTARTRKEKENQHIFFFWYKPENRRMIMNKLQSLGRPDMVKKLLGGLTGNSPKKKQHNGKQETEKQAEPKNRFFQRKKKRRGKKVK